MTNSTITTTSAANTEQGYVNATQHGWARVYRARTVKGSTKRDPATLHAFIAFAGGDGVDCKISGEDAKKLFLNHDLETLSQANANIEIQCTVGDVFSTTFKNREGKDVAGRKGRLLKISQLIIDGESQYNDGGVVFEQTTMKASGYFRATLCYNKAGVQTDAVTIQFVHGAKGELNSDSHSLDVIDLALIKLLEPYVGMAQAINPTYDPKVEGSKKYLHSVWVAATAVDCSSKLYFNNDGKACVGRNGTLKSISCINVDGEVVYRAEKTEPVAKAEVQTEAEAEQAQTPAQADVVAKEVPAAETKEWSSDDRFAEDEAGF